MRKKILALVLTVLLLSCYAVGSTVAWLMDKTNPVVNTFTYGDINIDLEETDTDLDSDDNPHTNKYQMTPGQQITKDPKITIKTQSKASWLFVKLDKSANFDNFLEYEMAEGWTQLTDAQGNAVTGVYFRQVDEVLEDAVVYAVIRDNQMFVKETVTKEMLNALDPQGQDTAYPTLTITAYAVQRSGFEPEISDGADAPTNEQIAAAALFAWGQLGN